MEVERASLLGKEGADWLAAIVGTRGNINPSCVAQTTLSVEIKLAGTQGVLAALGDHD